VILTGNPRIKLVGYWPLASSTRNEPRVNIAKRSLAPVDLADTINNYPPDCEELVRVFVRIEADYLLAKLLFLNYSI
jgi:hypothetical protein